MSPELENVTIQSVPDPNPDLSHLGEYRDEPGPEARTVDRAERGDQGHGERRFFVAANSPEDTGNPDSVEQDYERMEAFNKSEWSVLGIRAEAAVTVNGVRQTVTSGGLYGVASDTSAEHLEQVAREELAELRDALRELGVPLPDRLRAEWADAAPLTGTVSEEATA